MSFQAEYLSRSIGGAEGSADIDVSGYYRDAHGRNVTQWPFSMTEYQRRASTIVDGDFVYGPRR